MARLTAMLVSALLMISATTHAASPEQAYIAARDADIAKLDKLTNASTDDVVHVQQTAEKELTQMLVGIVGPVKVTGFQSAAKLNLGSLLTGDMGFGTLDGLAFSTPDDKGTLLVTTEPLYKLWIAEHLSSWEEDSLAPPTAAPDALLHVEGFYASALTSDAALYKIAEVPVAVPPGATAAAALLTSRSQDERPDQPFSIIAGLLIGKRLLIAEVPLKSTIPAVAACNKIRTAAEPKINAVETAYSAGDRKDAALKLKLRKLRIDAAKAFEACFIDKSKTLKPYQAAVAQAQALLTAMAAQ